MRVATLLELLPQGLYQTDEERHHLRGLLAPVAAVDALLDARVRRLGELLDPERCPDETVRFLAAAVGLNDALPAAAAATVDQLRRLIPVAAELWRIKGTAPSWRSIAASLAGSRSLIFDWFYYRTISGSSAMVATIPGVGVGGAGFYSYPERVSDLWISDPAGDVDTDIVARFLEEARPAGERINLYRAYQVDDLGAGTIKWAGSGTGAGSYDVTRREITATDSYEFAQDLDGAELEPWAAWDVPPGYLASLRLAVTDRGVIRLFAEDDDTQWWVKIDQAGDGVVLYERIAGVDTVIGGATQRLAAGFPYRWTIAVLPDEDLGSTTIRVYWEGAVLIDVVTSTASRASSGPVIWGSAGAGASAVLSMFLLRCPFAAAGPTRVGLTP